MSPSLEIARHRLQRAGDALAEADVLIASLRWRGALNRIYYAVFYAARALLAMRDLDSSRHSGVIALFQQQFVKTNVISANVARTLPRLFEARQTSDYADGADPADDDVRAFRTDADAFITACARVLDEAAAGPPGQV
jgi:uncharacterized protein (UPF0332 family)